MLKHETTSNVSSFTTDINECCNELWNLYQQHKHNEPDTLNEHILALKPDIKLEVDLGGACDYCYRLLKEIVKRYKLAPKDECEFIKSDVKRLCLLLFKPYFHVNWADKSATWLIEESRKYEKQSSDYKFEHGIIDAEPPEDIYNSIIIYLKDFVINLAI